ncbi:MAG: YchJ family metal-binding protein [Pseudomonadota bacterium]
MKKQQEKAGALAPCPCGRHATYAACCGRFHTGAVAPDAESLMRSRYTAYMLNNEVYLLATWHASTRPAPLNLTAHPTQWLGLEVKKHNTTGDSASVEFVARYRINGRAVRLHETSRFVHEEGCWYYVDGVVD